MHRKYRTEEKGGTDAAVEMVYEHYSVAKIRIIVLT